MRYVPAPDVLVAHLSGEAVLLDLRDKNYYRLNETAATVWKAIEAGSPKAMMLRRLTAEFEVTESDAHDELERLLADFLERGLVSHEIDPDDTASDP